MKKRILPVLLVLCMLLSLLQTAALAATYADVATDAWYAEAVSFVGDNGLMVGTEKGFEPDKATTRAMLWAILARLDGQDTAAASGVAWYVPAQFWSVSAGISDGTNPMGEITREQFVAMLYRHAVNKGLVKATDYASLSSFPDASDLSVWAVSAMQWAVGVGIIHGVNGRLNPQGSTTRAQAAVMLMNFCTLLNLNAKQYTVTFVYDALTAVNVSVRAGEAVSAPAVPTRTGYTFLGWYTAQAGGVAWNFATKITGDMTLYARWAQGGYIYHLHNYAEAVTTPATCTTPGVKTFLCACGASYTEAIAVLGHSWGTPTVNNDGNQVYSCTRTGCIETMTVAGEATPETVVVTVNGVGYANLEAVLSKIPDAASGAEFEIVLLKDIALTGWTSVANTNNARITLRGNGYKITGLSASTPLFSSIGSGSLTVTGLSDPDAAALAGNSSEGTFTVDDATCVTAAQLKAILVNEGSYSVKLTKNYHVMDAWTSLKVETDSIYIPIDNAITIDGDGHYISGLTMPLLAPRAAQNIAIQNLTIKDSDIGAGTTDNSHNSGALIGYADNAVLSLILDNCHTVNVNVTANAGSASSAGSLVGYAGMTSDVSVLKITGCTVKGGSVTNPNGNAAGIVGMCTVSSVNHREIADCTVTDCRITGEDGNKIGVMLGTVNGGGTLLLSHCTFSGCTTGEAGTALTNVYGRTAGEGTAVADVYVNNGVYEISDAAGLRYLASAVNGGNNFAGKTVRLMKDIDLEDEAWTPIGKKGSGGNIWDVTFNGTFDGNGKTISNLNVTGTKGVGLFGFVGPNATIQNVTIDGATVTGENSVGAVVGYGYLNSLTGCTVKNAEITANPGSNKEDGDKVGAIAGWTANGTISGNAAIDCVITGCRDMGGLVGYVGAENRSVTVSGNTVSNVTTTVMNVEGYETGKLGTNVNAVVGRTGSGTYTVTVESNTVNN